MQIQELSLSQWRQESHNKTLRQTFALLAVSMVPTVAGALIGLSMGPIDAPGWLQMIGFLVVGFGFIWAIEKNKTNKNGLLLLMGFTLFMGFMLSGSLRHTLGFSNGAELVAMAAAGTGLGLASMSALAMANRGKDLSRFKLNQILFAGLTVVIGLSVVNMFVQASALTLVISSILAVVSMALIFVDVKNIVDGGEDNYISATLQVYLDVFNLFTSLLSILTATGSED